MSLWVETPVLHDRLTGDELLSFKDSNWSLDRAEWLGESTVVLRLRKYPGNHRPVQIVATVDCIARSADVGGTQVTSLAELERRLDQALTWSTPASAP